MNFNPGDIATLEKGRKGDPGYQLETWKVGRMGAPGELSYGAVSRRLDDGWSIVSIDRALPEEPGTIGIATDDTGVRRVLARTGPAGAPWGSLRPYEWFHNERHLSNFVETCPYVPAALIREAEEWEEHRSCLGDELLARIVRAVRAHRREVELWEDA